jgi:hypothetical protein
VIKVAGSELAQARKRGAERTLIDFIGEIKDEFGSTIQNIRDKVDIRLTGQSAAELTRRTIEYDSGYTLLPGAYTIKVLARDAETGHIGTFLTKFVVPNLNKEERRIAISSVVLSGQRIELKDAVYTAGKDKIAQAAQAANPLVQEGSKLIPSVTRVFSRGREMFVYLQAYQQGVEAAQPLIGYVTFYRGQSKVFESAPVKFTNAAANRLKTTDLRFTLSLAKLPLGKYTCQVSVLNPADKKTAFWQSPVYVAP